jgi:hypothetical protein
MSLCRTFFLSGCLSVGLCFVSTKNRWKSQLLAIKPPERTQRHWKAGFIWCHSVDRYRKESTSRSQTLLIHSSYVVAVRVFRVVNVWCAFTEQNENNLTSYCNQQNSRVSFPKNRYIATTTVLLILLILSGHFSWNLRIAYSRNSRHQNAPENPIKEWIKGGYA